MKLTPLGDRVLIKVPEVKEVKTQSGLLLAGDAVEKPQEAEVVAVGKGRMFPWKSKSAIRLFMPNTAALK